MAVQGAGVGRVVDAIGVPLARRVEQRNPRTTHIDELSTLEMVKLINSEDHKVAEAVEAVCPQIAKAVDVIAEKLREGGRLIYVGCGTSGRLGILDAVECPPTYSTEPEMVQGLIAGGMPAIYKAVEGAEDDRELGAEDLMQQLNDWFAAQKGWNSRARQARIVDNAKFTIALFLVPMLSRGNWTISCPFAKRLHTLWMARYPKSPFTLASYDDLVSGFRKRWLCFITTAVCEAEGKPDDCAELTAFRRFRDGWLSQQPDGPALIEEYYEIAPAIVLHRRIY